MASTKQIEDYLQKIRRLPSNKSCANCRAQSRLGFGAVCVKYQSFVCDLCKSAHQSYSHRTKSVTMSTWTLDEVKALDEKNGGGNDWCRARWFARLSEAEAARWVPKEGDPLDNYKRFVLMAYEESKWLDENAKPASAPASTTTAAPLAKSVSEPSRSSSKQPIPVVKKATAPKPVEEDLLILDFESTVTVSGPSTPAVVSPNPIAVAPSQNLDDWGSFTASSPPQLRTAASASDDWTFHSAPPAAQQGPSFNHATLNNLADLYQPQAPVLPVYGSGVGPSKTMMVPGAVPLIQSSAGIANDPFAQLHSYHSAPMQAQNHRASSTVNGNTAPTMSGLMPQVSIQRSSSAPVSHANDPFAGLI